LTAYTDANPTAAVYTFCIDPGHPGYFVLCFKPNQKGAIQKVIVKVLPGAYEMMKSQYPDMRALTNGFKLRYASEMSRNQMARR
jgi:transcription elongation factor SPT6